MAQEEGARTRPRSLHGPGPSTAAGGVGGGQGMGGQWRRAAVSLTSALVAAPHVPQTRGGGNLHWTILLKPSIKVIFKKC